MMRNKREIMNTDIIIKLMEEKNITLYRLGKMTNLNESNLGKIVSGKTKDQLCKSNSRCIRGKHR